MFRGHPLNIFVKNLALGGVAGPAAAAAAAVATAAAADEALTEGVLGGRGGARATLPPARVEVGVR